VAPPAITLPLFVLEHISIGGGGTSPLVCTRLTRLLLVQAFAPVSLTTCSGGALDAGKLAVMHY
jgi:hypothetical protein